MNRRGRHAVFAATTLVSCAVPLAAQVTGFLGFGASYIEYDGFLASGAAVVAPALRFDSPRIAFAGQGIWTVFESGNSVVQGNLAVAWTAAAHRSWRVELFGSTGLSSYANQSGTGHILGGTRVHIFNRRAGGWVGASVGQSFGGDDVEVPLELSAAAWTARGPLALVGSATAVWQANARYVDLVGGLRWTGNNIAFEARVGARPLRRILEQEVGGRVAYFEISTQIPVSQRVAVTLGGGSYPTDPVRRIVGANYVNAGVQIRTFGARRPAAPLLDHAILRDRAFPEGTAEAALEIERHGDAYRLRIVAPGVASVEIMADFTDWQVVRLTEVRPGVWEVTLPISAGLHRFNIRFGDGQWTTPGGVRVEPTEFGGTVGLMIVPER